MESFLGVRQLVHRFQGVPPATPGEGVQVPGLQQGLPEEGPGQGPLQQLHQGGQEVINRTHDLRAAST